MADATILDTPIAASAGQAARSVARLAAQSGVLFGGAVILRLSC